MSVVKGNEWTFNQVAEMYDKWRPAYVPELYEDIFAYKSIDKASHVLEIGIGTGQATLPFLNTGCHLTAVELGDRLAKIAGEKFHEYPEFKIAVMPFQDYRCADNTFDLIYSASAFHWIPEQIGYGKVYKMLKPGGVFARFACHPWFDTNGQEELAAAIYRVYRKFVPEAKASSEYGEEDARRRADIAAKYGFADIQYKLYYRTQVYPSEEYIKRISIENDKIALPKDKRDGLLAGIRSVIDRYGGTLTLYTTTDLNLARKM